jgi:hypothetical protein
MKILYQHLLIFLPSILLSIDSIAQIPLSWIVDEVNPGEDLALTADEALFTQGNKSCRLQLYSGAVPYLFSEVFQITPGVNYTFSIDVYDNDTAGQVKIYADFYDAYGFDIYGEAPVFSSDSSEWQTLGWEGTIPAQAVVGYILIKFYGQPDLYSFIRNALIWLDNARFMQSGYNLVQNGGFENWVVGVPEPVKEADVIKIYPNPAGNIVNFSTNSKMDQIIISDILGRDILIIQEPDESKYLVDVSELMDGVYFVVVINEYRQRIPGKFIVSRKMN